MALYTPVVTSLIRAYVPPILNFILSFILIFVPILIDLVSPVGDNSLTLPVLVFGSFAKVMDTDAFLFIICPIPRV